MPALTVHNAEIKTASVEIRVLTISGKQVTLAVFRQLREEPLIGEDGTFNGTPWGTVNYHVDKCSDYSEHLHVVWQSGTELLRSAITAPNLANLHPKAAHAVAAAAYQSGLFTEELPEGYTGLGLRRFRMANVGTVTKDRRPARSMSFFHQGVRYSPLVTDRSIDDAENLAPDAFAALVEKLPSKNYRQSWAEIQALPQLFIAV